MKCHSCSPCHAQRAIPDHQHVAAQLKLLAVCVFARYFNVDNGLNAVRVQLRGGNLVYWALVYLPSPVGVLLTPRMSHHET
jgi:hypothetical protein